MVAQNIDGKGNMRHQRNHTFMLLPSKYALVRWLCYRLCFHEYPARYPLKLTCSEKLNKESMIFPEAGNPAVNQITKKCRVTQLVRHCETAFILIHIKQAGIK